MRNHKGALILLLLGAGILAEAWGFMVIVGMIHLNWIASLPTIGYGLAVAIILVKFLASLTSVAAASLIRSIASD